MGAGSSVKLRPARTDEAVRLSELALRSKGYWGYSQEFLDACREELGYSSQDIRDGTFIAAEIDGEIIGFYALELRSPIQIELEALFVEPAFIGRGYGRGLMDHAKATAARMGAETMVIQGDPNAEAFYRAAGARCVGSKESASIPGRMLPLLEIELRKQREHGETRSPLPASGRGPGG